LYDEQRKKCERKLAREDAQIFLLLVAFQRKLEVSAEVAM